MDTPQDVELAPGPTAVEQELADRETAGQAALTDVESYLLETLQRLDDAEARSEHLSRALEHSRDIGAAIGIVMSRLMVTQDDAFDWLRRASQDQNRKLYDVACDVVATGDVPT